MASTFSPIIHALRLPLVPLVSMIVVLPACDGRANNFGLFGGDPAGSSSEVPIAAPPPSCQLPAGNPFTGSSNVEWHFYLPNQQGQFTAKIQNGVVVTVTDALGRTTPVLNGQICQTQTDEYSSNFTATGAFMPGETAKEEHTILFQTIRRSVVKYKVVVTIRNTVKRIVYHFAEADFTTSGSLPQPISPTPAPPTPTPLPPTPPATGTGGGSSYYDTITYTTYSYSYDYYEY